MHVGSQDQTGMQPGAGLLLFDPSRTLRTILLVVEDV
jgi:hypothetical protein